MQNNTYIIHYIILKTNNKYILFSSSEHYDI